MPQIKSYPQPGILDGTEVLAGESSQTIGVPVSTIVSHTDQQLAPIKADGSRPMQGPLTLAGDPTEPGHAANKDYVDNGLLAKPNSADLAASTGASLIGVTPDFTGIFPAPRGRSIPARVREDMRVTDFYPYADEIIGRPLAGLDFPQARNTGFSTTFDDGPFFQAAATAMAGLNETRLRLPRSFYRIVSQVVFNGCTELTGDGFLEAGTAANWTGGGSYGQQLGGTVMKIQVPMGNNALLFDNGGSRNSKLSNFMIVQDQPAPAAGWAPINYDYVAKCQNMYGGMDFENLGFVGVTNGISCYNGGRLSFRGLRGQVFNCLLNLDLIRDVVDVDYMRFFPAWSGSGAVIGYQQSNLNLVQLGRVDGFNVAGRLFVLGANNAVRLSQTSNGFTTDLKIFELWADLSRFAMYVDSPQATISVTNFVGQGEDYNNPGVPLPGGSALFMSPNSGGGIFVSSDFRGSRIANSDINNQGNSTIRPGSVRDETFASGYAPIIYSPNVPVDLIYNPVYNPAYTSVGNPTHYRRPLYNPGLDLPMYASDPTSGVAVGDPYKNTTDGAIHYRKS